MTSWIRKIMQAITTKKTFRHIVIIFVIMVTFAGVFAIPFVPEVSAGAHEIQDTLPGCIETSAGLPTGIDFSGCFANLTYYIVYIPASFFVSAAGEFFDTMLSITISKDFIDADFANEGWALMRDISNIGFIFILLYIAFATILQIGDFNTRTLLTRLIIIALLINFSLFFTKVVIDTSNILALGFYNNISTAQGETPNTYLASGAPNKNISLALVRSFSPQTLISGDSYTKWAEAKNTGGNSGLAVVFIVAAAINLYAAYLLFVVGLLFLFRLGGLWFAMIGAPVAFLAYVLNTGGLMQKWWKFLLGQAFLVPIFLFFLYLIVEFIVKGGFLSAAFNDTQNLTGFAEVIISVIIKSAIVLMVLSYALKITRSLSTEAAGGLVNKITSVAKGAAMLPLGFAGARVAMAARAGAAKTVGKYAAEKGVRGAIVRTFSGSASNLISAAQSDIDSEKKKIGSLSSTALKNIATSPVRSQATREAITEILTERKELKPEGSFTSEFIASQKESLKNKGRKTEDIDKLNWQYAQTTDDRVSSVKNIEAKNIKDLDEKFFEPEVVREMHKSFNKEKMKAVISRDDKGQASKKFFEEIGKILAEKGQEKTTDNVTEYFNSADNYEMVKWMKGAMAQNTLKGHGFEISKETSKEGGGQTKEPRKPFRETIPPEKRRK